MPGGAGDLVACRKCWWRRRSCPVPKAQEHISTALPHWQAQRARSLLLLSRETVLVAPAVSAAGPLLVRAIVRRFSASGPFYWPKIDFAAFVALAAMEFALASSDPVDMPLVADAKEESNCCKLPC
jgi:hypothetical protein